MSLIDLSDEALDQKIQATHRNGEIAELAALYLEAADRKDRAGDREASFFLLTHAYVLALEAGEAIAVPIRARLVAAGRES